MIESVISYQQEQRELYLDGFQYARWKRKYGHTTIFREYREVEATTKLIPIRHPPPKSARFGFGELFTAIHYIDLGYDVSCDFWGKNWNCPSYFKAIEILGSKAADFICKAHPQPPDLLVVDRKGRFFFAEAKLPTDGLNPKQRRFFREIENYLNGNMPQARCAPYMQKGHWIKLVRLKPLTH